MTLRMNTYPLQRNIPIPDQSGSGRPIGKLRLTMMQMEVGHSFLYDGKSANSLWKVSRVLKIKIRTRTQGKAKRVWRIK